MSNTTKGISFEFFPPNTPVGQEKLRETRRSLNEFGPEFFSVTYGAGGAAQEKTLSTVVEMKNEGLDVAPHISCIGSTHESIAQLLARYQSQGVTRVVALRGDLPSGAGPSHGGDFRYAADLVRFIRDQSGAHFHIEVAAYPEKHPQAESPQADLKAFVEKANAGASSAITQYFFNADAYFRFRDELDHTGVKIPIIPGIMPITNYTQLNRFSQACGAEIPRWVKTRLASFGDDSEAIKSFGFEVVARLCEQLLSGGAPGLHFYTLNQAAPTLALCDTLGRFR